MKTANVKDALARHQAAAERHRGSIIRQVRELLNCYCIDLSKYTDEYFDPGRGVGDTWTALAIKRDEQIIAQIVVYGICFDEADGSIVSYDSPVLE